MKLLRLHQWLAAPSAPYGLAAFRVLFGLLIAVGNARFVAAGWPEKLYGEPRFFFRFAGFDDVWPVTAEAAVWCHIACVPLGLLIALGLLFRPAVVCFTVLFAWLQLGDVTNYLNHYWLVILLGFLLCFAPATACWALDNVLFSRRQRPVARGFLLLLRGQVACVYVFAAIAKIGPDWLMYGQPLGVWLPAKSELPLVGPLLAMPLTALLLSWGGFLYDATIVPLLLHRRTRAVAYALVLVFHGLTSVFFSIGMFPVIMAVATTLFFAPDWPRTLWQRLRRFAGPTPAPTTAAVLTSSTMRSPWPSTATALFVLYAAVQLALPLRCFALADNVLWDEVGMRFSWRVMVREKSGALSYRVTLGPGHHHRVVVVNPHDRLTWRQVNEMVGQPDMILQLAHAIRDDFNTNGFGPVEVRADSTVTLNGRRAARLIDPTVDLARVDDCVLCRPSFVLPAPTSTPPAPWRAVPR
jgi:vitamin K-dependent gamma-carboxylase